MTTIARNTLSLGLIAAVCTTLVAGTWLLTRDRIAANEQAWLEQSLAPALGAMDFEGTITMSRLDIPPPHDLPGAETAIVYRVFDDGRPRAALFTVTARDGYAGPIRLLLGVTVDGRVTGLRILQHRETPGLGDRIDQAKSDWVTQFPGHALGDPPVEGWALRTDGGEFDQLSGASVTPRAVIGAVRKTLVYFDAHRDALFSAPATEDAS